MRKREEGELTTTVHSWSKQIKNWDCSNSNSTLTQSYPFLEGKRRTMTDVVTPRFQQRSSQGEVIVNPMTISEIEITATPGTFSYYITDTLPSTPCNYTHTETESFKAIDKFYGPSEHQGVVIDIARLRALAGTQAAASVEEPDFAGLVFIGELRETLGFLKNPVKSWSDFVKQAKRDKNRSASKKERLKTVGEFMSDSWLSYRYGARPLLSESEAALQAVYNTIYNVRPTRLTARGFASDSGTRTSSSDTVQSITWTRDNTTNTSVKVRAGVLYEHFASSDTFGVGVQQVPSAVWELIPYSFVVDWFANVGSFVSAITPKIGVRYLGKWTTIEMEQDTTAQYYASDGGTSGGNPRFITSNGNCTYVVRTRTKTRSPGISVDLVSKVSPYSGDIGQKRIVDTIALTEQLLRSR